MAVYRYGFDIHQPNMGLALGAAGLGERMRANRMREEFAQQEADVAAEQRKAQARQARREQEREALIAYRQGVEGISKNLPPEARGAAYSQFLSQLAPGYPANFFDDVPQQWDENFAAMTLAQVPPQAPDVPAAVQVAEWYRNASPEQREAYDASKKAGAARIDMGLGNVLTDQPLTPDRAAQFSIPEERAGEFIVRGGKLEPRPLTEEEKERRRMQGRRAESEAQLNKVWADYMNLYTGSNRDPVTGQFVLSPDERKTLAGARQKLVAAVAKTVLGTPGAEPGPLQYQQAGEMVPDWGVASDALGFRGAMSALLSPDAREKYANQQGGNGEGQGVGAMPYEALVDRAMDDEWLNSLSEEDFQALEERLRRQQ